MKEVEREYQSKNAPYYIEKAILDSMKQDEIREFVADLHTEYSQHKSLLDTMFHSRVKEYNITDEAQRYFIEKIIYKLSDIGEKYTNLQNILERIDQYLKTKEYSSMNYANTNEIDINDIPISQVISRYRPLPKNLKRNLKCFFPGHKDHSPSFRIYEHTNSWYCFGEGIGGNAINFISHMENCTTKEAYKLFVNLYFK